MSSSEIVSDVTSMSRRGRGGSSGLDRALAVIALLVGSLVLGSHAAHAAGGPAGEFFPVSPRRVLDTREGIGASVAKVRSGNSIAVKVTGIADLGVPASGVLAVAINVTATNTTAAGYVTVFPTGASLPTASNLNVLYGGHTTTNLAVVGVGSGGQVSVYVQSTSDIVFDLVGWYAAGDAPVGAGVGSRLEPVAPQRILDTREGIGAPLAPLGRDGTVTLQIAGRITDRNGRIVNNLTGVVINLTGTEPTGNTFVTAYPAGEGLPVASNLNLTPGLTRPNLVMVKTGAGGAITLYNHVGNTQLVADVVGFYRKGADPNSFFGRVVPLASPFRTFDTRDSGARLGPDQIDTWDFTPFVASLTGGGQSAGAVAGVIINFTGTQGTADSFFTAYPSEVSRPFASNLNLNRLDTVPNLAVVPLSQGAASNRITTYLNRGFTHYLGDVGAVILSD